MEKTNKISMNELRGSYNLIARHVGCSRKYVAMVLENKLGKYTYRDTEMVNEIRKAAEKLQRLFK